MSGPPVYSGKYRSRGTYNSVGFGSQKGRMIVHLWEFIAEHIDLVHEQDD